MFNIAPKQGLRLIRKILRSQTGIESIKDYSIKIDYKNDECFFHYKNNDQHEKAEYKSDTFISMLKSLVDEKTEIDSEKIDFIIINYFDKDSEQKPNIIICYEIDGKKLSSTNII